MQAWEERYYAEQEAREEGRISMMKELIAKKLQKGKSVEEIADWLEESVDTIQTLIEEMREEETEE